MPAQLTKNFGLHDFAAPSAAAFSIANIGDVWATVGQPFCYELPQAVFDVIAADPAGELAHGYRRYIRTVLVPGVQHVAELLKANSATIEWPTKEWLAEQFPEIAWAFLRGSVFGEMWLGYARGWDRVLAEWDEAENFAVVRPTLPMPFGGLSRAMAWSRERGEAKQQELIGMTAEAEVDMGYIASTAARIGAERSVDATDGLAPSTSDAFESEET